MNNSTMNACAWVQEYQRPFVKRRNVECHSGHLHQSNVPAAGFVLVRLNASSQLEVLLELRSRTVAHPNTYGCIGGSAATKGEEAIDTAYREAKEEFGIEKCELNILGPMWKRDHGGIKYLTYTYIFAEYNSRDGLAPTPTSSESVRSQWFTLDSLPDNLIQYLREDLPAIKNILYYDVFPTLLAQARQMSWEPQMAPTCTNVGAIPNPLADVDGDTPMCDANTPVPVTNTANSMTGDAGQVSHPALAGQGSGSALFRGTDSVSPQQEQLAQTIFPPYPKLPSQIDPMMQQTIPMQQSTQQCQPPSQTVPMQQSAQQCQPPSQTVPMQQSAQQCQPPSQTVPMQQQTIPMQQSTQQCQPPSQTVPMQQSAQQCQPPSQTVPMQQQTIPMQQSTQQCQPPSQTVPMQQSAQQCQPPSQTVPMQQQTIPMQQSTQQCQPPSQTVPMQQQTIPMQQSAQQCQPPSQTVPMQSQAIPMQQQTAPVPRRTRRQRRTIGWRGRMFQNQQQRAQRKLDQWQLRQTPLQQGQQQDYGQQILLAPEEKKVNPSEPQINKMAATKPEAATKVATESKADDATKSVFSKLWGPFSLASKNNPADTAVGAEKKDMGKQATSAGTKVAEDQNSSPTPIPPESEPMASAQSPEDIGPMPGTAPVACQPGVPSPAAIPPQMNEKEPEFAKHG